MNIPFPRRTLAAALCVFPLAATAQSPVSTESTTDSRVSRLSDIVVTPSRTAEPLSDVVGDVTVIGPKQLANAPGESLAQIIGQVPGVQFTTNGGSQTVTSLFIRGTSSTQSLILIDGMRINAATSGGAAFPAIDPAMVERIEILRGAASSLYGSDAIGGVVNIITKKGEQDRPLSAWANVGYGTYETSKSSLGLSGASDGWDYSLSASANDSKGFDATRKHKANNNINSDNYADKDGYRSHALSGTLGYQSTTGHRIGLAAYNGYTDGDFDKAGFDPMTYKSFPLHNVYSLYRQQAYALTSTDRITDAWESVLSFGWNKDTVETRTPEMLSNIASLRRIFSWQNNWEFLPQQRLSLLTEHTEERIQSSIQYDKTARNTNAVGLIYKGKFDRLHTQASVRNDNYTGYGNKTTGSLGFDYDLSSTWQIGIAGNTGFRMPTFNDLYWPGFNNPNLKPEKSRNIEAHVTYDDAETHLRLAVYQNKIRNMIVPDSDYYPVNIGAATIRGLTLTGEQNLGDTTLRASADFLDPRNDNPQPADVYAGFAAEGSTLPRRARQVFHASVEHRIQALKLGAEYEYTGNRYDDAANQTRLGGFSLVNLTAAYDFSKSLGVQVRWNNVFDKDYVLVDGYNTPGSNVFVNLSWRM
ncbi:TonB-dependent receptor [Castellaniella caeni]